MRRMRRVMISLAVVIAVSNLFAPDCGGQQLFVDPQFDVKVTDGIVYGVAPIKSPPGDFDLLLDLYEPIGEGVPTVRPSFIIIHGGSFINGSRKDSEFVTLATEMAARGYTAVSIDYRLYDQLPVISDEFKPLLREFKTLIDPIYSRAMAAAHEDATTAHRWMTAQASQLGIDVHRIAIGGGSAGAVTSMGLAYIIDDFEVIDVPEIHAVMDKCGSMLWLVDCMETGESPIFIAHGEEDDIFNISEAEAIANRAIEVGIPLEYHPIPGAGHEFDMFTIEIAPGVTVFDGIVLFFYDQLNLPGLVLEMAIQALMDSMDAIDDLDPSDLKNENLRVVMKNKVDIALDLVHEKHYVGAREKLSNDVLMKMDGRLTSGQPDKNDWIITVEGQNQVQPLISMAIGLLDDIIDQI